LLKAKKSRKAQITNVTNVTADPMGGQGEGKVETGVITRPFK
jgi:hypothetical protein